MLLLLREKLNSRGVSWSKQEGAKVFVRTHLSHTFTRTVLPKPNPWNCSKGHFEFFTLLILTKTKKCGPYSEVLVSVLINEVNPYVTMTSFYVLGGGCI